MDKSLDFKPRQILFLECGTERLYTELIQVVKERQLCWVRPLFLADKSIEPHKITDLRSSSDLLWSINLFQPAMEVEVIPFFSDFAHLEELSSITAKQQLHNFIQKLWVQGSV
ncbi:hypothetical protein NIES4071_74030 [Calothrix sp. NIES-4071]|nr:hypothetical protein NIES4071_74030 [Calothrix sp. NIES-4071]BAZ61678.1 hypothetical protein NIES4105_73980 [Calothrix sp. NIES-4105]